MSNILKKQIPQYFLLFISIILISDSGNSELTVKQRLFFVLVLLYITQNREFNLNKLDVVVLTYLIYSIINNTIFKNSAYLTLPFLSLIICTFLYIIIKDLFIKNKYEIVNQLIYGTHFTVIFLNVLYIFFYKMNILNNPIPFTNTTLAANFLALTSHCLITINSKANYSILYSILYSLINQARIAMVVFSLILVSNLQSRKIAIMGVSVLIIIIFFVKQDSSIGRFLIAKISVINLDSIFLKPIGFGEFANWYMPLQSKYLNNIKKSSREYIIADNTEFAFNDFLQLFIELGLIGLLLYLTIFVISLKYIKKFNTKYNFSLFIYFYIFISFFSYIFYVDLFKFIFFIIIAYISSYDNRTIFKITEIQILTVKLLLLPLILYNLYWHFNPHCILDGKYQYFIVHPESRIYDEAYILYSKKDFYGALDLLKKIELSFIDLDLILLKAKCYEEINDLGNASTYYNKAYHMYPNKFKPKYHLFKFLKKYRLDASIVAQEILETPVKVNNSDTQNLIKEAKQYLYSSHLK